MYKNIDFDVVADLYDYYVIVDTDISFYRSLCKDRKNILELMCGTGRVSLPLIREGFRLTCVDYSQKMLNVFRSKLKEADKVNIVCQDICSLDMPEKYDLAFIPFNSIAEITDNNKRAQAFERIHSHLMANGLFFCSLYNPAYRIRMADGKERLLGRFAMSDNNTLVVSFHNHYSRETGVISGMQYYQIFDEGSSLIETRKLEISFSVIPKDEILEMACNVGFKERAIYGDYEMQPFNQESRYMNFLFQKA